MDPHAMGMQGGGMSVPMSMGMGGGAAQPLAMGMSAMYGAQPQMMMNVAPQMPMAQPQMPMGSMAMGQMGLNPAVSGAMQAASAAPADWRIQLTREHRANLIAKIYNEMVRVSADPVPGIKLWMNVSWYELSLYKESPTQEVYINKIFTRLKSLRAQQSDMNAAMAAQSLPNQGMLSRLDFSYYSTLNLNQRGGNGQVGSYPGHNQFSGPGPHPGAQQQPGKPMSAGNTPVKTETSMSANSVAEYWQQHAALRAKHQGDVEKVHGAFKKYVDHMKGHDETEQKKKLRYLLSYVELCANILSEDKATHPPRKIEELDKVFKYIVKIVNPYLKKLRTETDKRSYPSGDGTNSSAGAGGQPMTAGGTGASTSSGVATSSGSSTMPANTSSGFSSAMTQPQAAGQNQQQNANPSMQQTSQQKQQQYMMQQRSQQMQAQARQQQMMQQQQQMMRQQQMQQKNPQQAQFSAQPQQQNSQNAANQQSGQQTQQQMGQQRPQQSAQNPAQQQPPQQKPQQPQQPQQAQPQQPNQPPTSRGENPSISSGLSLGLDDSLYGSMGNDLLQMPTPSGASSGLMDFSSALSPTSFGGMDLLDWDDGTSGQGNASSSGGGDSSDLMTFVETL